MHFNKTQKNSAIMVKSSRIRGGGNAQFRKIISTIVDISSLSFVFFLFLPTSVFAAGGLNSAEKLLTQINTWLYGLSAVTVTIAILVVGYKIMFGGQTIRECTPIIIGAVLIASASSIAGLLLG